MEFRQFNFVRGFINCLFFFIPFSLSAQSDYSIDPEYIKQSLQGNFPDNQFHNAFPDTGVTYTHRYMKRNFLGNVGLSSAPYYLNNSVAKSGFILYTPPVNDVHIAREGVSFLKTKGPYASLTGIAGNRQLQMFKMLFANSFKNGLNFTMRLNRYSSQGFYSRQQSFVNNFYSAADYTDKKAFYSFRFYTLINNNRFQENGGLRADTLKPEELLTPKELLPVKMNSASRDNRELSGYLSNRFRLSNLKTTTETAGLWFITQNRFDLFKYKFTDAASGSESNYFLYYIDTLQTKDSTRQRSFSNEAGFLYKNKMGLKIYAGYEYEHNSIWQYYDTVFQNHIVKSDLLWGGIKVLSDTACVYLWNSRLSFRNIISGNQQGDYHVSFSQFISKNKQNKEQFYVKGFLYYDYRTPDYFYRNWYSNHFVWENRFNPVQTLGADMVFGVKELSLNILYKNISNLVYIDKLGYPMQYFGNISNAAASMAFNHVLWNHLGVRLNHIYQYTGSSVIQIPENISSAAIYYSGNWFKNNLQINTGIEAEYFYEFTPYAYLPATQQFILQDRYKAGNFMYTDFYLNARVRPVTVFLKVENVLHGLLGTNYNLVPGYYQPDRAFRFGLKWEFFD